MAFSQNSQDHCFYSVEYVESVTKGALSSCSIGKSCYPTLENHSTKANNSSVGSVAKNDLQAYFSTLSTEMEKQSVDGHDLLNSFNVNELWRVPRIPQDPRGTKDDSVIFLNHEEEAMRLIFGWLRVILSEGHIEASQQDVGRVIGWPVRSISVESLFVDFDLWCRKQAVSRWSIPGKSLFFSALDEILCREGDRYVFPPLDECGAKFAHLRAKYEST